MFTPDGAWQNSKIITPITKPMVLRHDAVANPPNSIILCQPAFCQIGGLNVRQMYHTYGT